MPPFAMKRYHLPGCCALTCVIGQAAHDGGVKDHPVAAAVRPQEPEQLLQLLCDLQGPQVQR
jgi:hypothetical protein